LIGEYEVRQVKINEQKKPNVANKGLTTKAEDLRWLSIAIMRIDRDPPIECPAKTNLWLGAVCSD
jgi:hypothetical protein